MASVIGCRLSAAALSSAGSRLGRLAFSNVEPQLGMYLAGYGVLGALFSRDRAGSGRKRVRQRQAQSAPPGSGQKMSHLLTMPVLEVAEAASGSGVVDLRRRATGIGVVVL